MKKLMGILLATSMVFSLAACGSTADTAASTATASAATAEGSSDNTVTALGKLEDLYEQCVSELEDAKAGLDECRENGFQDDLAYGELMVTKLGLTQLTKQFDIATGYAEPDPEPYQYQPKEGKPAE